MSKGRYGLASWIDFGGRYIYPDNHDDEKYAEIISKQMDESMRGFVTRISVMLLAFVIGMSRILYMNAFMGETTTFTQIKFPFIEAESYNEFFVNFSLQAVFLTYGLFGYFGMEVGMEMVTLVVKLAPKIVEHEFQKLNKGIEDGHFDGMQIHLTFRNIVVQIMDTDRYELPNSSFIHLT